MIRRIAAVAASSLLAVSPAFAATKVFTAKLSGDVDTSKTGSKATGTARIVVDTDNKTVNMTMEFDGLKIADLSDGLIARPVGPIHLHNYLSGGEVVLVLPAPFGPGYADTAKGFSVAVNDLPYAAGAGILKSTLSFEGFLAAMASGTVVLNVHTDRFGDGEISGQVTSAAS